MKISRYNNVYIIICDVLILYKIGGAFTACGGGERRLQGFGGTTEEIDHTGDTGVYRRIIIRWIFRTWDLRVWTESSWFTITTGGGHM